MGIHVLKQQKQKKDDRSAQMGLNNHLYIIILIAQYALKIDILIQSELKLHQIGNILELWTHKRHTRLAGVVD